MIIAALDTGMRKGEMLAVSFGDIDLARGLITLRGETTKSRRTRLVPIATARLRAVLDWLQLDADGQKKPADAPVFSDATGEPIGSFRTAWVTTVLKAQNVTPMWKSYNWTALMPECKAEFKRINLHWHDLRHEYASRLVEKGVPLARCAISSATRPSPPQSATTTRSWRTSRPQRRALSEARRSIPSRGIRSHRQFVKFLSRVRLIRCPTTTRIAYAKRALTLRMIRI